MTDTKGDDYVKLEAADATAVPTVTGVAVAKPVTMVEVVAPADLPEGYTFEAEHEGTRFPVIVPAGGVKKDQRFMVPMESSPAVVKGKAAVTGKWKDGLFNCFTHGVCHPHVCLACWCRPLAMAQVMTRMRLNWHGEPGSVAEVAKTFRNVIILFVSYLILSNLCYNLYLAETPNYADYPSIYENPDVTTMGQVYYHLQKAIEMAYAIYLLIATCRTRQVVRNHYDIPEENCKGCEDCCCAFWCSCCTVTQMMRHTADYEQYPAACCTETGLPSHAPQTIV